MFFFFKGRRDVPPVDIHSHLLPAIDDGSRSVEESQGMLEGLGELGFQKLVTTPHIHPKFPNTSDSIHAAHQILKEQSGLQNLNLEAAAEYFVDENFRELIKKNQILSFGESKFVLIESPFLNKPIFFEQVLHDLKNAGFSPVIAHPERYQFLKNPIDWCQSIRSSNVYFQVSYGSFVGYYGKRSVKVAFDLLQQDLIDFLGTDLHRSSQLSYVKRSLGNKRIRDLIGRDRLLNAQLI
ncbi:MAG: CpsB/CapC family capsule biosynthesis tyrosine phosphatase [Bacteroidota bacterium]